MKFHLNYTPAKASFQISHKDALLLVGSCFSENIGNLLKNSEFNTSVNPGGILFNPSSIHTFLHSALQNEKINEDLILERDAKFYSYLHHSSFSSSSKIELIEKTNTETSHTHLFLKSTKVLIITFGTAFIYQHKKLKQTVANCHKQPSDTFTKKLLEVDQIVDLFSNLIEEIKKVNPSLKIIFTVSPVKHLKDGVELNNISKCTLLLSIHKLVSQHKDCFYFPAFELVNDDLRDYRFYKEDLAHPNELAIEYVWQKFSETYFNSQTLELNQKIKKLNLALNHREIQGNEGELRKLAAFIEKQKQEIRVTLEKLS